MAKPIDDEPGVPAPSDMESDEAGDIIDLDAYRRRRPENRRTAFAVWGGEGERSRLALPLWRAIYLVGGERGALVWVDEDQDPQRGLNPFFVLDLAEEDPRTSFSPDLLGEVRGATSGAPLLAETVPGGVAVFLGVDRGRRWFLVVDDGGMPREAMEATSRNDLLFIAGECSGLILHRRLDEMEVAPEEAFDWDTAGEWEDGEEEGSDGSPVGQSAGDPAGDGEEDDGPDPDPDPEEPRRHLRPI